MTAAASPQRGTVGMCEDCGQWTSGRFVRHIPANSGPGTDVVTHDVGTCPGKRPS